MRDATPSRKLVGLVWWLLLSFAAGGLGAIASVDAAQFYDQLHQSDWTPPAWLFGPVWTLLYLLIGIAAWLVWRVHGWRGAGVALLLFVVQLAANALWTWLFFGWHQGALAFAEVVLLWLLIVATTLAFYRLHKPAAVLMLPYLAWVGFAAVLCLTLWQDNPHLLG